MSDTTVKPVSWIGSRYKDFRAFPDPVQDAMGYALYHAQIGEKHGSAKPRKGFGGAGVLEIVADHVGDTFRAAYTVKFATAIYVLHAFQKKSKSGIKTSTEDLKLIQRRLKGQFRDVSVERLMRLLTRLGCDVDITIRSHGKAAPPRDTIRIQAAAL